MWLSCFAGMLILVVWQKRAENMSHNLDYKTFIFKVIVIIAAQTKAPSERANLETQDNTLCSALKPIDFSVLQHA